ncbi:MAG: hypothetical protein OCC49_00105 [Fibrobacterales bacterium]
MRSLLVALTLTASALFADAPTASVLDFDAQGIENSAVIEDIQERFITILAVNDAVNVMSLRKRDSMLERKGVMVPTRCEASCKKELGTALETDYLIIPSIEKKDGTTTVHCELFDVTAGKTVTVAHNYVDGGISKNLNMISEEFFQSSSASVVSGNGLKVAGGVLGAAGVAGLVYLFFFNETASTLDPIIDDVQVNSVLSY